MELTWIERLLSAEPLTLALLILLALAASVPLAIWLRQKPWRKGRRRVTDSDDAMDFDPANCERHKDSIEEVHQILVTHSGRLEGLDTDMRDTRRAVMANAQSAREAAVCNLELKAQIGRLQDVLEDVETKSELNLQMTIAICQSLSDPQSARRRLVQIRNGGERKPAEHWVREFLRDA
jgi:hypothetical protein